MALAQPKPKPPAEHIPIVTIDPVTGVATMPQPWIEYIASTDSILRLLANSVVGSLISAANDAAAAAAGVPVGGLYRTGNAVQIRLV